VREDQRERLRAAMVELTAAKGYPAVRISDLARIAHVSPPTLYDLYSDKEQLFLGAYEDLTRRAARTILGAYATAGEPRRRLNAAMHAFAELAASDPPGVSLLVLGAFGAGTNVLQRRQRSLEALEAGIHSTRDEDGPPDPGDLTVKAILGGIREVTATRLRDGRHGELPGLAPTLSGWAGCYPTRLPSGLAAPPPRSEDHAGGRAISARAQRAEGRLPSGRSDLARKEIVKSQRERIVDATAAIVAEKGLAGLTILEIARRANVSNQTFYSIYDSKQDAFLGTQKVGLHQALHVCGDAYESRREDWPQAIAAGIRALLDYLASEPAHAQLSLVQMYGAGPEAIAIRDASMRAFSRYLSAGAQSAGPPRQPPEIVAEAVVGGIWQILHHYIEKDSVDVLPAAGPQLTYFALAPFLGPGGAAEVALLSS
jgi:AcrR family transcriptional regulator